MEIVTVDTLGPTAVLDHLVTHGVVHLRGADPYTQQDFVSLSEGLMLARPISGPASEEREVVGGDDTTTTVTQGTVGIPLHREASYTPGSPSLLMFYCERPAAAAGATLVCDGVALLHELHADLRRWIVGLRLRWEMELLRPQWHAMTGADDPDAAAHAIRRGVSLMPWEDLAVTAVNDRLMMAFDTPCAPPSLFDGEPAFCNSLLVLANRAGDYAETRLRVGLADSGQFPADALAEVARVGRRLTRPVAWRRGDILVVNNTRFMHGRQSFEDTGRRVLVRMGYLRDDIMSTLERKAIR